MRHRLVSVVVLAGCALRAACAQGADTTTRPPARAPDDTTRRHPVDNYGLLLGMAVVVAAPAAAAGLGEPMDSTEMTFWGDHVSAAVDGGVATVSRQKWAHGAELELLRGHVYGEVSEHDVHVPQRLRYQAVRGGYLFHPKRGVAGGVVVGVQRVAADPKQSGVSVALPLLTGTRRGTVRLEATYVFSRGRVSGNYLYGLEAPLRGSPFVVGMTYDARSFRIDPKAWKGDRFYTQTLTFFTAVRSSR